MVAIMIAASALAGCSFVSLELNNRGGYIDATLDERWIIADTKPMRLLRAYVLVGSITRLAQTKYESERELIVRHVNTSIKVASDAYYCAYAQPGRCVFFDERMVELEVAVLRLLVTVLSSKDDEELFEALGKEISDTFPMLKAVDSLNGFVDAVTSAGEAAVNAGKAIQAVLKVGQSVYFKGRRLGALYRDSIELNMIAVMSSLDTMCAIRTGTFVRYSEARARYETSHELDPNRLWAINNFYGDASELPDTACLSFKKGFALWQRGSGDLSAWVDFLSIEASQYRGWIIPNEEVFIQASDLIWRSCEHLTSDIDELSDCIGRRKVSDNREEMECAIKFDSDADALRKAAEIGDEEKATGARSMSPYTNACRLILYAKTVEMRADRRRKSGADTRIYWLSSHLAPSPSHPLKYHPGQQYEF
jgi:hypothetical protein